MATQSEIADAISPYGIEIGDAFMERYHNDQLVNVLVTIVLGQQDAMKATVKEAFDAGVKQAFDSMEKQFDKLGKNPP